MSLTTDLQARYQARREQSPADVRDATARATRELAATGQAEQALSAGDRAPLFDLADATGGRMRLAERLSAGPVVPVLHRGAWCPHCNLALCARSSRSTARSPRAEPARRQRAGRAPGPGNDRETRRRAVAREQRSSRRSSRHSRKPSGLSTPVSSPGEWVTR
jgi:hypothetical protein